MHKSELIAQIAAKTGLSQKASGEALDATMASIVDAVAAGDSVSLVGFGTFSATQRAERSGRNPKTGEAMVIPASTAPKFSAGATFKARVKS